LLDRYPKQLSGGQAQRVAVGRAIVKRPEVFLFDEPLSNLDAKLRASMRVRLTDLHRTLREQGQPATVVYVTHDQIEAMTMADRIVVMHDGIIEQIGTPLELFDHPRNLFVAQFIGSPAMNVLPGEVVRDQGQWGVLVDGQRWPAPDLAGLKAGQAVHNGFRPTDVKLSANGEGVPAEVTLVEPTGSETELMLRCGERSLVMVIHGRTAVQRGDQVHLFMDAARAHVFDSASEQRIA
jgi:multiple sugar transport system ATP-binding protein